MVGSFSFSFKGMLMLRFFERRFLSILILLLVAFFTLTEAEVFGAETPINFPDPNLERVIRDWINKPTGNIYESDLVRLTVLSAWSESISDLSGLEYCTNLSALWIGGNSISDISALSRLTKLIDLELTENSIRKSGVRPSFFGFHSLMSAVRDPPLLDLTLTQPLPSSRERDNE